MPHLALSLFGSPQIQLNGVLIDIPAQKALALLAYLAVTRVPHRRDALATLFWPDYEQTSARTYLRQALYELTKLLGHHWFDVSREDVGLAQTASIPTDVHEFRRLVNERLDDADTLRQAIALYKADFLAGFALPDCPEFDQWQLLETEILRHTFAETLQRLLRWHMRKQEYASAIELGRRWLTLDPFHEPAYRTLMQLYVWSGQQAAALRQFEECKRLLRDNLQTLPDPETQTLYNAIRNRRLPSPLPTGQKEGQGMAQPSQVLSGSASELQAVARPSFLATQAAASRPSRFVTRERELGALSEALSTARLGTGQILFVIGGAGRGKTTLVQEFARRAQDEHAELLVASGTCNAYTGSGDPYLPFREILVPLAGDVEAKWAGGLMPTENARRLWEAMPTNIPTLVESAPDLLRAFVAMKPLLGRAESFASPDADWFQHLHLLATREQPLHLEERQLFTQFTDALKAIAAQRPLLLILEDLHWVDAASNNLLFHLSRMLGQSRILVIGTYRPEELMMNRNPDRHPLASIVGELKRQHGDIWLDLGTLSPAEGRAFVDAYVDTQPNRLDEEFRAALFRHTGGHALFTVELLREMQARGDLQRDGEDYWIARERPSWSVLPAKVEGVIEQRISRLENGLQEILAVASIEGESFTAEVVARVRGQAEYEIVQRLSQELDRQHRLVTVEAMDSAGSQRLSRYRFRHHLFQRYLYDRLTASERAYLHEKVGYAMESLYGEHAAQIATQLAYHFSQAGLVEKAVGVLLLAGQQAEQLAAHREAIQHLTQGLDMLKTLPQTSARAGQELDYLMALGKAMDTAGNFDHGEIEVVYLRARTLCLQLGESRKLWPVLYGLYLTHFYRGQHHQTLAYGEEMLKISLDEPDSEPRIIAYLMLGSTYSTFGNRAMSLMYLEQALALYDPIKHQYLAARYNSRDIRLEMHFCLAITKWKAGYADQAKRHNELALQIATETGHPYILAQALLEITWQLELHRAFAETRTQAAILIRLAAEHGYHLMLSHAYIYDGAAMLEQGQAEAGLARLLEGISNLRATGNTMAQTHFASLQARGYAAIGEIQTGLALIEEALAMVDQSGEHAFKAELHRLKGELLHMQGASLEYVEDCFEEAVAIARHQEAKIWELRATVSLCKLWRAQGKSVAAYNRLAEIYHWFTEGFDTADLMDAKALLEELTTAS